MRESPTPSLSEWLAVRPRHHVSHTITSTIMLIPRPGFGLAGSVPHAVSVVASSDIDASIPVSQNHQERIDTARNVAKSNSNTCHQNA